MEKATLPLESASEPKEAAHQPLAGEKDLAMSHPNESKKSIKLNITFAEPEKDDEVYTQSSSSTYKEALSQPTANMSHRQKLQWLQKRRGVGLWAQCDDCQRWRWLAGVLDSHELPDRWYCKNNPDSNMASCSIPEAPLCVREEEDLIHNEYSCGSLVWARLPGWPWWPAMVDDCPDTEQFYWLDGFSDIPTYYNVVFFDSLEATRAWIAPESLKPYESNIETFRYELNMKKYKKRLEVAMKQASYASQLSPAARLEKYSFIARFKGPIVTPKKISRNILKRHQKKLENKYHVPFSAETSEEESEGDSGIQDEPIEKQRSLKRRNVIIVGTPKSKKPRMREMKTDKVMKEAPRNVTIVGTPKSKSTRSAVAKPAKKLSVLFNDTRKSLEGVEEERDTPDGMTKMDCATKDKPLVETSDCPKVSNVAETSAVKQPRKLRDLIEDSINCLQDSLIDTVAVNGVPEAGKNKLIESASATESAADVFKEPNSMAVQCGSNKTITAVSDSSQIENSTLKTEIDVPESQTVSEPNTADDSEYRNTFAPSPSSDDFEF